MTWRKLTLPLLCLPLLLAAAALAGCVQDEAAAGGPSIAAATPAAPAEPLSDEQASEECWMKYERGKADLPLDARAKLVDKCIAELTKRKPAS